MSTYAKTSDVLVVGGGLAGLVCAAALAELGLTVEVLEASTRTSGSFRGELLHARGVRLLKALRLESALEGAVDVAGFATLYGDQRAVRLPYARGGGLGAGFEHAAVVAELRREIVARGIRLSTPFTVNAVHREGDRITGVRTPDGELHRARLVIAADGRHSRMRRLFGLREQAELLSYTVVASVPRDSLPEYRHGHVLLGGPGPVLAYPYTEDRARMCIDVPLTVTGGREKMREFVLSSYPDHIPGALGTAMIHAIASDPVSAMANHSLVVDRFFVPGGVLVGDAGGCSHPLTATGMTGALRDAWLLADCIGRYGLETTALEHYDRLRRPYVRTREAFSNMLYSVFRGEDDGTEALRSAVFRYWKRSERARTASMAILSGDESDARAFVAEFGRVCAISAASIVVDAARTREPRRGLKKLLGVARASDRCLSTLAPGLLPRWLGGALPPPTTSA